MAGAPASDADDEYVQLSIPEAFIYKCPPRAGSAAYKAADFGEQVRGPPCRAEPPPDPLQHNTFN